MSYLALASLYSRGFRALAALAIFAFAAIARHRAIMLFASALCVVTFPKRLWERDHKRFYENKDVMGTRTEASTEHPKQVPIIFIGSLAG